MKALIKNDIISIVEMNKEMYQDVWQNSLDENNRRFVPDEVFETLEETIEVVDQIIENYDTSDGPFIYAVIRNEDDSNLGYVQLVQIEKGWEIGYHIAQKYCGHGYATEAVSLFLKYLKENTDLKEIYGVALMDNIASRRVLQKNGFVTVLEGKGPYQGQEREIVITIRKF